MPSLQDGLVYRVHHRRKHLTQVVETDELDPRGGSTIVEIGYIIELSDGTKGFQAAVSAEAVCSDKDSYNRKRGRDIALGRAMREYGI